MSKEIIGISSWDENIQEWVPYSFKCSSLEDLGETIRLLEEILPHREFRPENYTEEEFRLAQLNTIKLQNQINQEEFHVKEKEKWKEVVAAIWEE